MKGFSKILVDVDASAEAHRALADAAELAARCGAVLKIVDVLEEVPQKARGYVTGALEEDLIALRRTRLASLAAEVTGVPVTTELVRGRPALALVREVLRGGHDLLVRSHGRDLDERGRPPGPIDMELLRQCPCPVWLVGSRVSRHATPRILAAVHASLDAPEEQALNEAILDLAIFVRDLQGGELSVMQAWTAYGEELLKSHMPAGELDKYVAEACARDQRALNELVGTCGGRLKAVAVELMKGEAEDVIERYVSAHGIDLVVMGTIARTGLVGVLMGNTAERVLRRLRVSVLATKPPGFTSPITL